MADLISTDFYWIRQPNIELQVGYNLIPLSPVPIGVSWFNYMHYA